MAYSHTQRAPVWIVLLLAGAAAQVGAWLARDQWQVALAVSVAGGIMMLLSLCIATLTVRDEGHSLLIRYGPVPLLRKRIAYESISDAKSTRSTLIDGWGIHYVSGRGWTYNLCGRSCVQLTVNGRTIRIGSDDADNLARFIQSGIALMA